jgi:hypothetical protein
LLENLKLLQRGYITMKTILTMTALFILISGIARAGNQYDACINQEKALKTKETRDCSGLRYLLDPSSCYKTQRELKEYTDGKCAAIGATEQVDECGPNPAPEKRSPGSPLKPAAAAPATAVPDNTAGSSVPAPPQRPAAPVQPQKPSLAVPLQQTAVPAEPAVVLTCDQLKTENARLKADIMRLRSENEQLRTR